ncbi:CpsB/CapC family capsule biosynthesis tyrosine phosphatase [Clostridium sp. AL.422]|uniref:tyrosine-protein phosphatase n=1 Tax=Clostridium TaxID=1485 RepID=UPI00293DC654|nr:MULTISPECIES: CpsB/CapC family capsule biosynthesis tyrosine phosphatase [unclassified Clostridium]MDV4150297.1 CpsB/CapC family capsule biosynthesis tyrosine phosphatase [Clostridium sp. AL.422]
MVDLHSHLIWEVDDGSKSREMTVNMLRQAARGGTKKLVLTPHYLPGYYAIPINEVREKAKEISILAKEEGLNIEIYCGQEVYFNERILESYESKLIGTINESRYMLIEFNMRSFGIKEVIDILYELQLKGIVPVIAHPERYIKFIKNPSLINEFIREGFLFQLNIGSISGDFGKEVKKTAEIFIRNRIYSFLGSDAHRDEKRTPDMSNGIKELKTISNNYLNYLISSGEELLNNEEIMFIGNLIKEKKGLLGMLIG